MSGVTILAAHAETIARLYVRLTMLLTEDPEVRSETL